MNVLIVITKLYIGGFSSSLLNFLHCMEKHQNIKIALLMLENEESELEKGIPSNVNVIKLKEQEYKNWDISDIAMFYAHYRYVFIEYYYKYFKKKPIPQKYIREFAQIKLSNRAKKMCNDFSFVEDYDVVISWEEEFCNYVMVNHMPAKHKIGYIHPNYIEAYFSKSVDDGYLAKMERIITVSDSCRDTLKSVFPRYSEKIECIPNRINRQYYLNLAENENLHLNQGELCFLTVARIVDYHKAVFRIVSLAKRLKDNGKKVRWYVIGDGPDLTEMRKRIKKAGLQNEVICLGALNNPYPYMKQADLYIQQSHYEGRPVSVDESLLLGVPALITNYSSAHEQIDDGITGWIVDDDETAIYKKLEELIDNPQKIEDVKNEVKMRSNSEMEDCSAMISMLNSVISG